MTRTKVQWFPIALLSTAIVLVGVEVVAPPAVAVAQVAAAPTTPTTPVADAAAPAAPVDEVPALPDPDKLPGGRPGLVFYLAFAINRILWLIKKWRKMFPERWQPYLPAAAAALGLAYGVLELVLYGTPWLTAILTGLAGAAGAVAWREGVRAVEHAKNGPKDPPVPPKAPDKMDDDELAGAAS